MTCKHDAHCVIDSLRWRAMKAGLMTRSPTGFLIPSLILFCSINAILLFVSGCSTLSEFRNPSVSIPIDHPPGIGIHLTKAAFAPPEGNCSANLATVATRKMLDKDIEVTTDQRIVATQGDPRTVDPAQQIPTKIILSLRDTRCDVERSSSARKETKTRKKTRVVDGKEEEYEEEYTVIHHTRSARFDVGVSVRASDFHSGEVVAAWEMQHSSSDSHTDVDAIPDYPSESTLRDSALRNAGNELMRWLLPWTEKVNLVFYDAEECDMATTYSHFLAGDSASAALAADRSIEACSDPKVELKFMAAAHYNAGLLHFFDGRYTDALELLITARSLDRQNRQVSLAFEKAGEAQQSSAELQRIDALAAKAVASNELELDSISVAWADAAPNMKLTLAASVLNNGERSSDETMLRWYRLRDLDSTATEEVGVASVASIAPGTTIRNEIQVPVDVAGFHYQVCIEATIDTSLIVISCSDAISDAEQDPEPSPLTNPAVVDQFAAAEQTENFALDATNANPQGLTVAGKRVYVVDDRNRKVYVYTMAGARHLDAEWDLDGQKVPTGIAHSDSSIYIVDWSDDKVYVYTTAGVRNPDADFNLVPVNGSPTGVAHAEGRLYVVDSSDDKVYVYMTSGERDPDADFELATDNRSAAGIAFANERLYIVDDVTRMVYGYTTAGERDPGADFVIEDLKSPRGIVGTDDMFLVVDSRRDRIRVYPKNERSL